MRFILSKLSKARLVVVVGVGFIGLEAGRVASGKHIVMSSDKAKSPPDNQILAVHKGETSCTAVIMTHCHLMSFVFTCILARLEVTQIQEKQASWKASLASILRIMFQYEEKVFSGSS